MRTLEIIDVAYYDNIKDISLQISAINRRGLEFSFIIHTRKVPADWVHFAKWWSKQTFEKDYGVKFKDITPLAYYWQQAQINCRYKRKKK